MTEADLILLQRYIDGELDAASAERVRIRIGNSAEWQRAEEELLDDLAHVSLLMASVDRTRLTTDYEQVPPSTADVDISGPQLARSPARPITSSRTIWLKAAAVLLVVVGGATVVLSRSAPDSPSTIASAALPDSNSRSQSPSVSGSFSARKAEKGAGETTGAPSGLPERVLPASPKIELAGAKRTRTRSDTIAGVVVAVSTYEIRPGLDVILEVTDAASTVTRGTSSSDTQVDTTATFQLEGDRGTLTWFDATAKRTVRITGRLSEAELRVLRERVRVTR